MRILQSLPEILVVAGFSVKQYQRVAGDAAFVGFNFVWFVTLAAAIRRLRKFPTQTGRAREARVFALVRRVGLFDKVIAHVAGDLQNSGVLPSLPGMIF